MIILKETIRDIREYPDYYIDAQIQKYTDRKYNICIKMENGIYSQKQADKNYERASKICNLFQMEKSRRMQEQDKVFREMRIREELRKLGIVRKIP